MINKSAELLNRQTFQEELQGALGNLLLSKLNEYVEQWFGDRRQLTRYISALERKQKDQANVAEALPSILRALEKLLDNESAEQLLDTYQSAVDEAQHQFPAEVEWQQHDARFIPQNDDSLVLEVAKRVKRLARSNPVNWQQQVPLQHLVGYHLYDMELISSWHQQLQRVQMEIITDIEQLLVTQTTPENQQGGGDWTAFADELKRKLDNHEQAIRQKIADDIDQLNDQINQVAEKTGTLERRSAFYKEARITSRKKEVVQQVQLQAQTWTTAQKLLHGRTELMLELSRLHRDIFDRCALFRDDLKSYFTKFVTDPLTNLYELLERGKQETSAKQIHELKERLMEQVNEQMIGDLKKEIEQQVFTQKAEHFFDDLLMRGNHASQERTMLHDMYLERNPPEIDHRTIDWRLLVVRQIREQLVSKIQPLQKQYEGFLSELLEDIHDISNVIDVNLESAVVVEDDQQAEKGEDAEEVAREALQRLLNTVEELQNRSEDKHREILESIRGGQESFIELLLALVHEGDLKELQLLNAKYKAKETTKGWQTVIRSTVARIQDQLALWSRFGWKKARSVVQAAGIFLGFLQKDVEETKRADIATYLSETDQKMRELPYIYRRLFNFDAEADQRFYVQTLDSTSIFKKAYSQWQQSFPSTLAVVGEKGSGKSTFLNLTLAAETSGNQTIQLTMHDTIWTEAQLVDVLANGLDINDAQSIQEIIETINSWPTRKVVCIECVQNCFLRNLNGYEAIEKLCYLISETKTQIFWVVSCSRYGWRFLDKTVQLSEYFSHLSTTDVLDADQIKKVILNRHRSSGYTLHFEAGNDTLKSRSYRKLMDDEQKAQEYLQENYFKKLTELAEGNASVAMIFWIRSIRTFDDTYCYIQPLEVTSVEMIEDLNPQVLFTLAAFVLHDTITDEDLSMIMHLTREESRLMINRLKSRGLLIEKDGGHAINHLMYRQIVRVLKERNIIHLV